MPPFQPHLQPPLQPVLPLRYDGIFIFNQLKFQIVAAAFLFILEITYIKRRKLPILSSWCFTTMMIFAGIYMCADISTVFTIGFLNQLPAWLNRMTSQIFIGSINSILFCIYLYISVILRNQKRMNRIDLAISFIIYIVSISLLTFAPLNFYRDQNGFYAYGVMATSCYVISMIYTFMILIKALCHFIKDSRSANRRMQINIFWITAIWIVTAVSQFLFPRTQITSLGIVLIIFLMYLSMENPGEYYDKESGAFNSYALKLVLQERIDRKRNFFIVNVDIEDLSKIETEISEDVFNHLVVKITDYLFNISHMPVYRSTRNSFTILVPYHPSFDFVTKIINITEHRFNKVWEIDEHKFLLKAHCDFIRCPNDISLFKNITEIIDFIADCHTFSDEKSFVRRVDEKLLANFKRQNTILDIIKDAITNKGFEMYFQPIYNIAEEKFTNSEALVRLKDKETIGFISPEEFIPMAEHNGLIMKLSDNIFDDVLSFLSSQNLAELGVKHVEVNLSGVQSVDPDLPNQIKNLLKKYNISPNFINLEVTESMAVTSNHMLKKNMEALKQIGCTFSMDDFGTGYSNLSQIAKIDYELIKIDKSLLWPCFDQKNPDRQNAKIILDNMIDMILKLGKQIVVEGVETEEQFNYLKKMGVTYIQGYYFSKPLNQNDYVKFLKEKLS